MFYFHVDLKVVVVVVGLFVSGCTLCLLTSLKNRRGRRQSRLFICMSRIMLMLTHFSSFTASRSIKTTQGRMELLYLFFFFRFLLIFVAYFFVYFLCIFFFCRFFQMFRMVSAFCFGRVALRARARAICRLNLAAQSGSHCPGSPRHSLPFSTAPRAPRRLLSCSEQFLAFSTVRRAPRRLLLLGAVFGVFHCSEGIQGLAPDRSSFWRFPLIGGYPGACSCSEHSLAFSAARSGVGFLLFFYFVWFGILNRFLYGFKECCCCCCCCCFEAVQFLNG